MGRWVDQWVDGYMGRWVDERMDDGCIDEYYNTYCIHEHISYWGRLVSLSNNLDRTDIAILFPPETCHPRVTVSLPQQFWRQIIISTEGN